MLYFLGEESSRGYQELGCWKLPKNASALFVSLEGENRDLDGLFWNRLVPFYY